MSRYLTNLSLKFVYRNKHRKVFCNLDFHRMHSCMVESLAFGPPFCTKSLCNHLGFRNVFAREKSGCPPPPPPVTCCSRPSARNCLAESRGPPADWLWASLSPLAYIILTPPARVGSQGSGTRVRGPKGILNKNYCWLCLYL